MIYHSPLPEECTRSALVIVGEVPISTFSSNTVFCVISGCTVILLLVPNDFKISLIILLVDIMKSLYSETEKALKVGVSRKEFGGWLRRMCMGSRDLIKT